MSLDVCLAQSFPCLTNSNPEHMMQTNENTDESLKRKSQARLLTGLGRCELGILPLPLLGIGIGIGIGIGMTLCSCSWMSLDPAIPRGFATTPRCDKTFLHHVPAPDLDKQLEQHPRASMQQRPRETAESLTIRTLPTSNAAGSANIPSVAAPSTTPPKPTTTTLSRFPSLPKELRLQIWKLALPDPQLFGFRIQHDQKPGWNENDDSEEDYEFYWDVESPYSYPGLLGVNHESREIALRSYSKLSACRIHGSSSQPVYVDYSRDTFYFPLRSWHIMSGTWLPSKIDRSPVDFNLTKNLAVAIDIVNFWDHRNMAPGAPVAGTHWSPRITADHARALEMICAKFPNLDVLWLAVNRRSTRTGPISLIEPILELGNILRDEFGNVLFVDKVAGIVDDTKRRYPHLHIPKVEVKDLVG